jgi:hypothetical protein
MDSTIAGAGNALIHVCNTSSRCVEIFIIAKIYVLINKKNCGKNNLP